MDSLQSLARKTRHEIEATVASPTSVHTQSCCDDTAVNLPNIDSVATSPRPSVQKSKKPPHTVLKIISRTYRLLIWVLCSIVLLPLLLVSYLSVRLLQFIRHGHAYYTATKLKLFLRIWMYLCMTMTSLYVGLIMGLMAIFKHNSYIYHGALGHALSLIPVWLYFFLSGICCLSFLLPSIVSLIISSLPIKNLIESDLLIREGVVEIIDCLLLWLIESELVKYIPAFKHHKILGFHTHKWIKTSFHFLICYNIITLATRMMLWMLQDVVKNLNPGTDTESPKFTFVEYYLHKNHLMYYGNGMKHNMNFLFNSLMLLTAWLSDIGSHLDKTPKAQNILKFGTRTCISIIICSVLWLIKTCVLLSWEAQVVYNRLRREILVGGKQLFFLGVVGRHSHDIFNLLYDAKNTKDELAPRMSLIHHIMAVFRRNPPELDEKTKQQPRSLVSQYLKPAFVTLMRSGDLRKSESDVVDEWVTQIVHETSREDDKGGDKKKAEELQVKKLYRKVKRRVEDDLLIEDSHSTIYGVQRVAKYILSARKTLLTENYISDILLHMKIDSEDGILKQKFLKEFIDLGLCKSCNATDEIQQSPRICRLKRLKPEWEDFQNQLHDNTENIGEWMERAVDNCLFLANTMSSAKEAVDCLNKIISWLIIAATFIIWLFLTGLATTKVFVLIASPVLAATFIFGDTCKTLFQGIMFTYVVQPFNVGDLCVIDNKMMEVRTIGVWKTSLSIIGTQEEIVYTNSELSNKNIINHRTSFDWNDSVELDVSSLKNNILMQLQEDIKKYLDDNTMKFEPSHNCVALSTTEDKIKISITCRHKNLNLDDRNYSKCLKMKHEQRSKLIHHVCYLVDQTKNPTPETSEKTTEQDQEKMVLQTNNSSDG